MRHHSIAKRVSIFVCLITASWCVMTFTHEAGHIIGGWSCGAQPTDFDLRPWCPPYSFFDPDPHPLVTLWSGPIFGVVAPTVVALLVRRGWAWFIAYFCVLANGCYIATAWYTGDSQLDTAKLLANGASPASILTYCMAAIGIGYVGFRQACVRLLASGKVAVGDSSDKSAS